MALPVSYTHLDVYKRQPLSAEEVEKMGVEKAAPLAVDFNVGDTVQITAGPLEGFMGLDVYKRQA